MRNESTIPSCTVSTLVLKSSHLYVTSAPCPGRGTVAIHEVLLPPGQNALLKLDDASDDNYGSLSREASLLEDKSDRMRN
jgi:hypothetical protein